MDALSKILSFIMGLGGDVAIVLCGLALFALFIVGAMRNSARVGAAIGRGFGALVRFMAPGLALLIVFLFTSVVHAMSVKSPVGIADRSSPFVHGVVFLCGLIGRDFDTCGLTVGYRQAMEQEEANRGSDNSRYSPSGPRPKKALTVEPGNNDAQFLLPSDLLPDGYGESREDVNRFPQVFGLPKQNEARVGGGEGYVAPADLLDTIIEPIEGAAPGKVPPVSEAPEQDGNDVAETLSTGRSIHTNRRPIPGEPLG